MNFIGDGEVMLVVVPMVLVMMAMVLVVMLMVAAAVVILTRYLNADAQNLGTAENFFVVFFDCSQTVASGIVFVTSSAAFNGTSRPFICAPGPFHLRGACTSG